MSNWNPKPRFDADPDPLFSMEEGEVTIKSMSPIERQRAKDGSPVTATRRSALKAPDPKLTLKKGSMAGDIEDGRKAPNKTEPPISPSEVVKAFLGLGEIAE